MFFFLLSLKWECREPIMLLRQLWLQYVIEICRDEPEEYSSGTMQAHLIWIENVSLSGGSDGAREIASNHSAVQQQTRFSEPRPAICAQLKIPYSYTTMWCAVDIAAGQQLWKSGTNNAVALSCSVLTLTGKRVRYSLFSKALRLSTVFLRNYMPCTLYNHWKKLIKAKVAFSSIFPSSFIYVLLQKSDQVMWLQDEFFY